MPRPHGWQSQTPAFFAQVQTACCIVWEVSKILESWAGVTTCPIGAFWQGMQSRRCLSRRTAGAGGFIAQF